MFSKDEDKLAIIEKTLKDYSKPKYIKLVHPVKPGTICAAKFDVDGNYYRATVDRQLHHKKNGHFYEVTFLDYGNKAEMSATNLKKIDPALVKFPPLANLCTLSYIKVARVSHTFGKAAFEYFKEKLWGKNCTLSVVEEAGYAYGVVINPGKIEKPDDTIQAFLVQEGIASILESDLLPEKYDSWKDFEQEAKDEQLNIWEIDGGNIA
jgi:staphylococcal nuclease domain-containing protein 1